MPALKQYANQLCSNLQLYMTQYTRFVVLVQDRHREHAAVAMNSEGKLDHSRDVVDEIQGRPTLIHSSHQQVYHLGLQKAIDHGNLKFSRLTVWQTPYSYHQNQKH